MHRTEIFKGNQERVNTQLDNWFNENSEHAQVYNMSVEADGNEITIMIDWENVTAFKVLESGEE